MLVPPRTDHLFTNTGPTGIVRVTKTPESVLNPCIVKTSRGVHTILAAALLLTQGCVPAVTPVREAATGGSTAAPKRAPSGTTQIPEPPSTLPANDVLAKPPSPPKQEASESIVVAKARDRLPDTPPELSVGDKQRVDQLCERIANRLASVSLVECLSLDLNPSKHSSSKGVPILVREFPAMPSREPLGRVLLIGGVHGDELTSISSVFKWMHKLNRYHTGMFHWHIAPLVNPDGALRKKTQRTNANGVDLNRNLPTPNWSRLSKHYWVKTTERDPRRYPGEIAGSEPETKWLIEEIDRFQPDIIVSVHAPHGIVDFDALDRRPAPHRIGMLIRDFLGTYPGSLGNYAGVYKGIPVVTLELPHAYVMPTQKQITHMWVDVVYWLQRNVPKIRRAKTRQNGDQYSSTDATIGK